MPRASLFMSYLCDLFSILNLIFIVTNDITSLKQTHLFLVKFRMITQMKNANNFQIAKVQPQGVA